MVPIKVLVWNHPGGVDSQFKRALPSWQMPVEGINVFDLAAIDILFIQSASE